MFYLAKARHQKSEKLVMRKNETASGQVQYGLRLLGTIWQPRPQSPRKAALRFSGAAFC